MNRYKIEKILLSFLLFLFIANFANAQISLYYENLKFNAFYNFSKLIVNPVNKISYLNSLLEYTLNNALKIKNKNVQIKYLRNYIKILNDLEKEWSNFSFKYSQYKNLYERSFDLYLQHYLTIKKNIKDDNLESMVVKVLNRTVYGFDTEEGIKYLLTKLKDLSEKEKEEILASTNKSSDFLKKIDFNALNNLVNRLKKLTSEFEKGQRVLNVDYKTAEEKIKEIQENINLARKNILEGNYEEFNKNIKKVNENIEFLEKNSKLTK